MSGASVHPVYTGTALSSFDRLRGGRKYGRYDFGQFDQLTGPGYYLGKESIGDMEVACKFLYTKSRWGVLSEARNPGGIAYLDLDFTEPPGCRLRGATVKLTLDEDDDDLRRHFAAGKPPLKPLVPVQITEHGPQKLQGEDRETLETIENSVIPEINAGGIGGIGGVGRVSKQQQVKRSCWRFSSQPLPNQRGRPTTLRWDINENEFDRQPNHSNSFHTAFAFEHDGQPFFMKVEISGDLEGIASDLKQKVSRGFKRFKFPAEPRRAITLVNFGGRENDYTDPLDLERDLLPRRMVEANMITVPRVPGAQRSTDRFYRSSAETEEITIEEGDAMEDQNGQPYIVNTPTAADTAQLKADALSILSLIPTPTKTILQLEAARQSIRSDIDLSSANDGAEGLANTQASAGVVSITSEASPPVTQQDGTSKSTVNSEHIAKLLRETSLPPLLQLFILWLMSLGMR